MKNITQIIEHRKSVIKHAKNKGVQKTLEELKVSRATIYRWIKKFDCIYMNFLVNLRNFSIQIPL